MALSTTANKVIHNGNASATVFPFTFPIPSASYLSVIYTSALGVETTLSSSLYSVTGIGSLSGGSVTYPLSGSPIATGTKLTIVRTVPYTQGTVLSNQGGYYPEVVEARLDLIYMAMQQLAEIVGRYTTSSISDPATEQSNYALIQTLQTFQTGIDKLTTAGDSLTHNGSAYVRLARGGASQFLGVSGTALAWRDIILPKMHIYGLTYANNAGDATNDLDIAAGGCMDATSAQWIQVAALTKQSDAAWAVGNAAGGLDTGAVGNNDYYIWAILRSDTGVTDILYSLSSSAPSMPTNYDFKRLIGWFKRSGGTIVAFKTYETAGGGIGFRWTAPTLDVNLVNTLDNNRRTDAIKVPLNFAVLANFTASAFDATTGSTARITCPDETNAAPSYNTATMSNLNWTTTYVGLRDFWMRTSATGTIAARVEAALNVDFYGISTIGFEWSRR